MRRRWMLIVEVLSLAAVVAWLGMSLSDRAEKPAGSMDIPMQMAGARDHAYLYEKDGQMWYLVYRDNGAPQSLTPGEFAQEIFRAQERRTWAERLLNVSSPIGFLWVTVGVLAQVLFTGRMVVQWLASEKKKESVVPPMFWWMSLVGSTMLLAYFMWRMDPVGVLGQSVGWFIYVRNLWLIYRRPTLPQAQVTDDPAPEAELSK